MATKHSNSSYLIFCAASGLCGALSAACGKAAGRPNSHPALTWAFYASMLAVGLIFIFLGFVHKIANILFQKRKMQLNFLGIALFSAALRRIASLQATAASVSANILFSGLVGWALYSELLTLKWIMGVGCLVAGVVLVQPKEQLKQE